LTTTLYPNGIDNNDSIPEAIDLVSPVKAEFVNRLRHAVIAIENELGIDPSREFGTVRARLDYLQDNLVDCVNTGIEGIEVKDEGITVVDPTTKINFIGDAVVATDAGDGQADVEISFNLRVVQESILVVDDQTLLTLSETPNDSTTVQMYLNGKKQQYGADYFVNGSLVTFLNNDLTLKATDDIEFFYIVFGGRAFQETIPINMIGQVDFVLSNTPSNNDAVQLFVNGKKQEYNVDYTVSGSNVTFISSDLILEPSDVLEAWYVLFAGAASGGGSGDDGYGVYIQTETVGGTTTGPVLRRTIEFDNAVGVDLGSVPNRFVVTLYNQLIQDSSSDFTQRPRLRFDGNVTVSDDGTPGSEATVVDILPGICGGCDVVVNNKSDFGTFTGGVATLAANTSYCISGTIDLGSDRIVMQDGTIIIGCDKTTSSITSTNTTATISATAMDGSRISNVRIENTGTGRSLDLVFANTDVDEFEFEGVEFEASAAETLNISGQFNFAKIYNCVFLGNSSDSLIRFDGSGSGEGHLQVDDCIMQDASIAIDFSRTGTAANSVRLHGNRFESCGFGLAIGSGNVAADSIIVNDNVIIGPATNDQFYDRDASGSAPGLLLIANNILTGTYANPPWDPAGDVTSENNLLNGSTLI
jgi:hypothetical protein